MNRASLRDLGSPGPPPLPTQRLAFFKRAAARAVALAPLRSLLTPFLAQDLQLRSFALGVHLVGDAEISRLNAAHLRHAGVTDVLAFDYSADTPQLDLHGEIFVCVPEAIRQAARFRVLWPDELLRYIVHGILHLRGYRDRTLAQRQRMKTAESRWIRRLRLRSHT